MNFPDMYIKYSKLHELLTYKMCELVFGQAYGEDTAQYRLIQNWLKNNVITSMDELIESINGGSK